LAARAIVNVVVKYIIFACSIFIADVQPIWACRDDIVLEDIVGTVILHDYFAAPAAIICIIVVESIIDDITVPGPSFIAGISTDKDAS